MRQPRYGTFNLQIAVRPNLLFCHLAVCIARQENIDNVVGQRPIIVRSANRLGYSHVRAVRLAAAIQSSAAALEAGLMEQEQHYQCSAVLP